MTGSEVRKTADITPFILSLIARVVAEVKRAKEAQRGYGARHDGEGNSRD